MFFFRRQLKKNVVKVTEKNLNLDGNIKKSKLTVDPQQDIVNL
jgi:hypothetical protein